MVSIVYLTFRREPKFEWFLDSLWNQYQEIFKKKSERKKMINLELIFIDGILDSVDDDVVKNRRQKLIELNAGRFKTLIHQPPKPSPFQGKERLTTVDFFIAAGCRNTGACYASHSFIVFVDDLSILLPTWLDRVFHAMNSSSYVVAGSYKKVIGMSVENGKMITGSSPPDQIDSRWSMGSDSDLVPLQGGQLFGCSFGMPLEWYLELNGQNELCDSLGGEDYEFGMRLERKGRKIMYDRRMLTYESDDLHKFGVQKGDPRLTQSEYLEIRHKYGLPINLVYDVYDFSHFLLECAQNNIDLWNTSRSLIGEYAIDLRNSRQSVLSGRGFEKRKFPTRHFFTRQLLSEFETIDMVLARIDSIVPTMEGWCTVEKAHAMARLIILNQLRNCVELGVFAGRSMIPIALALRNSYPHGKLFAIDPWKKIAALEGSNSKANDDWWAKLDYDHFHRYTWSKIFEYGVDSIVHLIRLKSSEVVSWFSDESLDLLHQDANHSEETSTEEVHRWSCKIRSGGYWIFDDTNWSTTKKAQDLLVSKYGFEEIVDYESWKVYRKR